MHGAPASALAEKPTTKPVQTLLKTSIMFGVFLLITAAIHRLQIDNADEYRTSITGSFEAFWLLCLFLFASVEIILLPILIIQQRWKSLSLALAGIAVSILFLWLSFLVDSPAFLNLT